MPCVFVVKTCNTKLEMCRSSRWVQLHVQSASFRSSLQYANVKMFRFWRRQWLQLLWTLTHGAMS